MPNSLVIERLRVVDPDHIILGGNVRIRNGRIARIGRGSKVYRSSSRGGGAGL
jgi:alpha-D-ribose 1-methylphosphonate 5-triphosphate diphosphatase PhnM